MAFVSFFFFAVAVLTIFWLVFGAASMFSDVLYLCFTYNNLITTTLFAYLSFSMNFLKSLRVGLGLRLRQVASESSSEPNPLYGGISRGARGSGSALKLMLSNSSADKKT